MKLPMPPPRDVRRDDIECAGKLLVKKLGRDQLEVRVGDVAQVLTRNETFRLIGMLERVGGSL